MAFPNITDVVATTIQNRSKKLGDNVTRNNAFTAYLKKHGHVKTFEGGDVILQEFNFQENGNFNWYSGYDFLNVQAQDVITAAQYPIRQAACAVLISGLEQLQNSGRERMIDLLSGRIEVAEATMGNRMAEGAYSDGTGYGGKQLQGLASLIPDDPTTGTAGGVDRSLWPFWRSQVSSTGSAFSAMTAANLQAAMNGIWAKCVRGTDRPKFIISDTQGWLSYMASLQALQRFTGSESAELGFQTVKFMDADFILDGGIGGFAPANRMYFVNPKYVWMRPHKDRNMVPLNPNKRIPLNQDAEVQLIAFAGNMTSNGLQFQGLLRGA